MNTRTALLMLLLGMTAVGTVSADEVPDDEAQSADEVLGPVEDAAPLAGKPTPAAPPPVAPPPVLPPPPVTQKPAPVPPSEAHRLGAFSIGVALRASTLGWGAELIYGLSRFFNVRAQANFLNYDRDVEDSGVEYEGDLQFRTYGALVDWHPFAGIFRVSAGGYSNGNEIGLRASCPTSCEVGDLIISTAPPQNGELTGNLDFDGFAPYAGFGWGNAMAGGPWHFAFDVGALFQGTPIVDLAARGTANVTDTNTNTTRNNVDLGSDPFVQDAIAAEELEAQEGVDEFEIYPVVSFTLGYRFGD